MRAAPFLGGFPALLRKNCLMLFSSAAYYLCAAILFVSVCARFFIGNNFFVYGAGSSDLRQLFVFLPYPCILAAPALALLVRRASGEQGFDSLLPFGDLCKAAAFWAAVWAGLCAAMLPFAGAAAVVSLFGEVDVGQFVSGIAGSVLFLSAAASLCAMLCALLEFHDALALLISAAVLAAFTLAPKGFLWRFSSFGSGILSLKDASFYVCSTLFFLWLAEFVRLKKKGRKFGREFAFASLFELAFLILLTLTSNSLNLSPDISRRKAFSVSRYSRSLTALDEASSPVRLTYVVSPELSSVYPQVADVRAYLERYASVVPYVQFSCVEGRDAETEEFLAQLGIQKQQARQVKGARTEFIDVYSAIIIERLDKIRVIPFVLDVAGLEYRLAAQISALFGRERRVALACGNGLSIERDYGLVEPWLSEQGFSVVPFEEGSADGLIVFGSSELSEEQAESYFCHALSGAPCVFALSANDMDLFQWRKIPREGTDFLIPRFEDFGVSFMPEFASDAANFPVELVEGGGSDPMMTEERARHVLINYPLWISVLPQANVPRGMTSFWASPLSLSGEAEPFVLSSEYARRYDASAPTNPFAIEKAQKDAPYERLALGARISGFGLNCVVLGDQYCASTVMNRYVNAGAQGDFRNYLFLADTLLLLGGETELLALKNQGAGSSALYKISDEAEFEAAARASLLVLFVLIPAIIFLCFALACALRRSFVRRGAAL